MIDTVQSQPLDLGQRHSRRTVAAFGELAADQRFAKSSLAGLEYSYVPPHRCRADADQRSERAVASTSQHVRVGFHLQHRRIEGLAEKRAYIFEYAAGISDQIFVLQNEVPL